MNIFPWKWSPSQEGETERHICQRVDHWQSTSTGGPAPKIKCTQCEDNYNNNQNSVKKQTISVICTLPLWLHLCTQRQRLGPVGSTDHRHAHRSARATASTSHPLALDGLPKNNDNGVDVSLGSCARIFSTAHSCNNKRDPLWQPWRSATGRISVCERVAARGWRVCNS